MLYSHYAKEKLGQEVIELPGAFGSYKIVGPSCYVDIVYVHPEHRKQGVSRKLQELLLKALPIEVTHVFCDVDTKHLESGLSIKAALGNGFTILGTDGPKIILMKEIKS